VVSHAYEEKLRTGLSTTQFMKMRLIRLYPLYFIGFVLSLACLLLKLYDVPSNRWTLTAIIACAGLLLPFPNQDQIFPLNSPAWSLWCELVGNLAYALCLKGLTNLRLYVVVAACGFAVAVCAFISHRGGIDGGFTLKTLPAAFARFGFSFGLGVLLSRHRAAAGERLRKVSVVLSLLPLLVLFGLLAFPNLSRLWAGAYASLCALVIFPLLLLFAADYEPPAWLLPLFRGLGTASYPVYILQVPAALLVGAALTAAGLPPASFAPWSGILLCLILAGLSLLLVKYVEQPVRQRLRRLAQLTRHHVRRRFLRARA
jgi:peptidoglycan/LPS O-acetylase OafA/YrhL